MSKSNEILAELNNISSHQKLSDTDLNKLCDFSKNSNAEARSYVAELLAFSDSPSAEKILLALTRDSDELVRLNACDSIGNFCSDAVLDRLMEILLSDDSDNVRSYAALSLGDLAKKRTINQSLIRSKLNTENSDNIKISMMSLLYCCGDDTMLNSVLSFLNNRNYQTRCFCVNTLSNIVTENNKDSILSALLIRKKKEKSIAVLSSINRALNGL